MKTVLRKLLKGYAVFSALIVSAAVILYVVMLVFGSDRSNVEFNLKHACKEYMLKENPEREVLFYNLVFALDLYYRDHDLSEKEILNCLGRPDYYSTSPQETIYVYGFVDERRTSNSDAAVFITVVNGRPTEFAYGGINQATEEFKPYANPAPQQNSPAKAGH